jgi:hypothetical protein
MYRIVWTYTLGRADPRAFEKAHGPGGDWAVLFSQSPHYLGTTLYRDTERADHYLSVDYWTSEGAWRGFVRDHGPQCEALGNRLVSLTNSRERLSATSV